MEEPDVDGEKHRRSLINLPWGNLFQYICRDTCNTILNRIRRPINVLIQQTVFYMYNT